MFLLIFANFKSCEPSGDRMMPQTEARARAQASRGNITVSSHLKCF